MTRFGHRLSWPRSGGGGDLRALRLGARRRLRRRRVSRSPKRYDVYLASTRD
jgi:hypothetical protein